MKRGRDDQAQSGQVPGKRPASQARGGGSAVQPSKLTTNDALTYLREVKNRFTENKGVYDTFLEIMKEFKAQRIDTAGVIARVKMLFRGHRELILGFNTFLPKGYEIELARAADENDAEDEAEKGKDGKTPVEFDQAINYVNKIKARFASDERVYKAFLEILNMYRKGQKTIEMVYDEVAVLFREHRDLLDEFTYFLPDNSPPADGQPPRRLVGRTGGQRGPASQRSSPGYADYGPRSVHHKRKTAKRADDRGRGHANDDEDYRVGGRSSASPLSRELAFFERVKARIKNREAYQDFLKCLNLYSQEIISRHEMMSLVGDVIGRYPELVSGFQEFLTKCEVLDLSETLAAVRPEGRTRDAVKAKGREMSQKDKFLTKPLSELVVNDTERITPSYVKVPVAYPKLLSAGRTDIGATVLNDVLVNVTSGSEDYSFKLMRKNQYEEALFRCEDDRFEFEMAIETNASALKALRPIAEKIGKLSPDERAAFRLEDGELNALQMRAIERLYGEQRGMVLVDLLRKNPAVAVPVVLARLEQKDAEWRQVREDMTPIWRRIYEQNYHKSLDHRSFYFKQSDKKALVPKAMLNEMRDAAERRRSDEDHLRSLSMAARYQSGAVGAGGQPGDLEYDCSERVIFEDCYQILRTAITENLGSGVREQVLDLYLNLVEPFFGLPERTSEASCARAAAGTSDENDDEDKDGVAGAGRAGRSGATGEGSPESNSGSSSGQPKEGQKAPANGSTPAPEDGVAPVVKAESAPAAIPGEPATADVKTEDVKPAAVGPAAAGDVTATVDGAPTRNGSGGGDVARRRAGRSTYSGCKPLAPYTGKSTAAVKAEEGGSKANVLFGNENMYLFFRFHRHLFDRLVTARRCCSQKGVPTFRQTGAAPEPEVTPEAEALAREGADKMHAQFMGLVQALLVGEKEASLYEDECRTLLGTNSYELFTLDKLILKLIKHMHLMVADEQTYRLWELFKYERRRRGGVSPTVYHINCHAVIDDSAYRFEYRASAPKPSLAIQLVDGDKVDVVLTNDAFITDYLSGYVGSQMPPMPVAVHQLFLPRNLPAEARGVVISRTGSCGRSGADVADQVIGAVLNKVHVYNALECKIACATSKVSYVLDTEDVLSRKRQHRRKESDADKQRRIDRFSHWLEETMNRARAEEEALLALSNPMI